jgi:hypothetical protein
MRERLPRLFLARADEHLIQARFPASRRVAMNDSPFGRFVDRRDQRAYLTCIRLLRGTSTFVHRADTGDHAAIAKRSFGGLAGTFSGRFCVGHFRKFTGVEIRGAKSDCQDVAVAASLAAQIDNLGARNVLRDNRAFVRRIGRGFARRTRGCHPGLRVRILRFSTGLRLLKHNLGQSIRHNLHERAQRELIVKRRDVARLHSDATVARGPADGPLLRCAVNVYATVKRVGVLHF